MLIDGLPIPGRLLALLEAGLWPRSARHAIGQNLKALVSVDRIRRFAPQENTIYLYPPPFVTMAHGLDTQGGDFYQRFGAIEEIDPSLAIEIADFGIGADSPILLDYRTGRDYPRVIRLLWARTGGVIDNHWVACADSFDQFADMLALGS